MQQVEGQRLFALHVDVHDVRPDQVVGAQQIKRRGHFVPFEIAGPGHVPLDGGNLLLVHEDLQVAGVTEIHLGGE